MSFNANLALRVRKMLCRKTGFSERKMFGGICFMLNGHMCSGVLRDDLIMRVSREDYENSLKQPHTRKFDFTGKPMKGFVVVTPKGYRSEKSFASWMALGIRCARSMPAKREKKKRKR